VKSTGRVELDVLLAGLVGHGDLIGLDLLAETHELDRDGFVGYDGSLLGEHDLSFVL
jgi:hypothetical protein